MGDGWCRGFLKTKVFEIMGEALVGAMDGGGSVCFTPSDDGASLADPVFEASRVLDGFHRDGLGVEDSAVGS